MTEPEIVRADKFVTCPLCHKELIPARLICCRWCYAKLKSRILRGEIKL